jgi:hypothetical protein
MSGETLGADARGHSEAPCAERRAAARYRCGLETNCHAVGGGPEGPWTGKIYDISTTGIGVVLPESLDRGTILLVDLPVPAGGKPQALSACVIHARPHEDGGFFAGCILAERLGDAELEALLRRGEG